MVKSATRQAGGDRPVLRWTRDIARLTANDTLLVAKALELFG